MGGNAVVTQRGGEGGLQLYPYPCLFGKRHQLV